MVRDRTDVRDRHRGDLLRRADLYPREDRLAGNPDPFWAAYARMEPLFDHPTVWCSPRRTVASVHRPSAAQPIWVPAAYVAFYGGASSSSPAPSHRFPTMRTVWRLYFGIVAMSVVAEIIYISAMDVYIYPGDHPFKFLGYPLFLGFTQCHVGRDQWNHRPRLVPAAARSVAAHLLLLVPSCFAYGLFGSGIIYLSIRTSSDNPPMWALYLGALISCRRDRWTIAMLGKHLVVGQPPRDPSPATAAISDRPGAGHHRLTPVRGAPVNHIPAVTTDALVNPYSKN